MLLSFAVVSGLYQLHSWLDFVRGGSYVYRQGIKRIIGTWSISTAGAGNAFGLLGLLTLPFVQYGLQVVEKRWQRYALYGIGAMSVMSVLFSGTRAALVAMIFFVVVQMRSWRVIVAGVVMLVLLLGVIWFLPPELQSRYAMLLGSDPVDEVSRTEEIARASGRSRITGLIDGYTLATERPLTGYGPGTSMYARGQINPFPVGPRGPKYLQLHNLYGQVMAELGFVGLVIFLMLILAYYTGLLRAGVRAGPEGDPDADRIRKIARTLGVLMAVMLFYGMFGHTLYRFHWMFVLALQGALVHIALTRGEVRETMVDAARRRRAESAR
jgi:O-antigen ligase